MDKLFKNPKLSNKIIQQKKKEVKRKKANTSPSKDWAVNFNDLKKHVGPRAFIFREEWFKDMTNLNPGERSVFISLKFYAGKNGRCFPSIRRLSKDLKISINTTQKHLNTLKEKGFIQTKKQKRKNTQYTLKTF